MMDEDIDYHRNKNRLLWRCRLGTRELELILYRYVDQNYSSMSHEEQLDFQQLLNFSNNELSDWLLYGVPSYDQSFASIIAKIRDCPHSII